MGLYWLGLYYCSPNWFWLWPCLLWILTSFTLQINPSYLLIFVFASENLAYWLYRGPSYLWKLSAYWSLIMFLCLEPFTEFYCHGTVSRIPMTYPSYPCCPLGWTALWYCPVWKILKTMNSWWVWAYISFYRPMWCFRCLLHLCLTTFSDFRINPQWPFWFGVWFSVPEGASAISFSLPRRVDDAFPISSGYPTHILWSGLSTSQSSPLLFALVFVQHLWLPYVLVISYVARFPASLPKLVHGSPINC